jgi:Kef-type K+ transport system membrane component KefB
MNDVVAWVLLVISLSLLGIDKISVISVYVLLFGLAFVVFMMMAVKPVITQIGQRFPHNKQVKRDIHFALFQSKC